MKYNYSQYIGVSWESGGRDIETSLDCWGIVWHVYNNLYNIQLPSLSNIHIAKGKDKTRDLINKVFPHIYKNFIKIENIKDIQEGDIIIMRFAGYPIHIGLAISDKKMIHSAEKFDCVVDDFNSREWKNRIEGVYRHKNFK